MLFTASYGLPDGWHRPTYTAIVVCAIEEPGPLRLTKKFDVADVVHRRLNTLGVKPDGEFICVDLDRQPGEIELVAGRQNLLFAGRKVCFVNRVVSRLEISNQRGLSKGYLLRLLQRPIHDAVEATYVTLIGNDFLSLAVK